MAVSDRLKLQEPRWRIKALRRPVVDIKRAIDFYTRGLGFTVEMWRSATYVTLRLNNERLELTEVSALPNESLQLADAPDVRFQHAAIVVSDMTAAFNRLVRCSPRFITRDGPQQLPIAAGGVTAFKFRDPDGHPLELIGFPPSKGNIRWQVSGRGQTGPTIGIDHFAISVSDVQRSIKFYESALGLAVTSRQINSGQEQARLDGLDASVVDVVALEFGDSNTPHLELLGYRQPSARSLIGNVSPESVDCIVLEPLATLDGNINKVQDQYMDPDGHAFECRLY